MAPLFRYNSTNKRFRIVPDIEPFADNLQNIANIHKNRKETDNSESGPASFRSVSLVILQTRRAPTHPEKQKQTQELRSKDNSDELKISQILFGCTAVSN